MWLKIAVVSSDGKTIDVILQLDLRRVQDLAGESVELENRPTGGDVENPIQVGHVVHLLDHSGVDDGARCPALVVVNRVHRFQIAIRIVEYPIR